MKLIAPSLLLILPCTPILPVLAIILRQKSFLIVILCLEASILALVLLTAVIISTPTQREPILCLVLLVFGACEAALGLSLLTSITRTQGNDLISSLTISKC